MAEANKECIHGLEPLWCAICIHGPTKHRARSGGPIAGWRSMIAQKDSGCPGCEEEISAGDHIYKEDNSDDFWSCRRCAESLSMTD